MVADYPCFCVFVSGDGGRSQRPAGAAGRNPGHDRRRSGHQRVQEAQGPGYDTCLLLHGLTSSSYINITGIQSLS